MARKIRLTETQFHQMIARIVKETKHEYDEEIIEDNDFEEVDDFEEMDQESDFGKMTKEDAIERIADFLKSEVLSELSPKEISMLKQKLHKTGSNMETMNEEDEELDDFKSRRASRREKGMMRGGLAMAGTSAVALLGEFMGYSEFELTNMLHDINHMAGLGRYTGPVGVGLVALGLAAALKGLDMRMRRTGK